MKTIMPFERVFAPFAKSDAFFRTDEDFRVDVQEEKDAYRLTADLPGFAKENIHLDLKGDVLTLSAERHSEWEDSDKKGNYLRCERSFGQYSRSFDVSNVETDQIRADYNNGVLKLTLPKKGKTVPASRRIEIR